MKEELVKLCSKLEALSFEAYAKAQSIVDKTPELPPSCEARIAFNSGGIYFNCSARLRDCLDHFS